MTYTAKQAIQTLYDYLNIDETQIDIIPSTNNRGFIYDIDNEEIVIYVYPISCKKNNKQNFFDTRDSGVEERKKSWMYAKDNNLKYFCLGVNSMQDRYKDYIISLENSEEEISKISFREDSLGNTGTQVNIPATMIPDKDFERIVTSKGFNLAFINKKIIKDYLKIFDNRGAHLIKEKKQVLNDKIGYNKIFYGIPGCGKSYYIEHKVLENVDKEHNVFRTTFFLDYSNSDFIGQILPKVKDKDVTYEPIPGPFTQALERAFTVENEMVYLVIEELNRGNAAAIFGDVFQLLDRLEENYEDRVIGDSEYPITNEFIETYFQKQIKEGAKINYTKGKIFIPHNLTILATMNTSDQNVFPLDTAFKRRWDRERIIPNWSDVKFKDLYIPFTNYTWRKFTELINKKMLDQSIDGMIMEDKQIGPYFISKNMLASEEEKNTVDDKNKKKLKMFINNVIDYIYSDVSKFDRDNWFKSNVSFDDIYDAINKYNVDPSTNEEVFTGDKELCLKLNDSTNIEDSYNENEDNENEE